jgi:hypothetical protein
MWMMQFVQYLRDIQPWELAAASAPFVCAMCVAVGVLIGRRRKVSEPSLGGAYRRYAGYESIAVKEADIFRGLRYELLKESGGEFIPTGEYFSEQEGSAHDVINRRQAQDGISYAARIAED